VDYRSADTKQLHYEQTSQNTSELEQRQTRVKLIIHTKKVRRCVNLTVGTVTRIHNYSKLGTADKEQIDHGEIT